MFFIYISMLNFKKGRPLAKISGGEFNGEILYINKENNDEQTCGGCNCKKCSKRCVNKPCCKKCKIYFEESESSDDNIGDIMQIDDGKLIPIPSIDERSIDYIAGPSGSGKSTYAANLAKSFKKIFPEKDFFIFSRTNSKNDPAFKGVKQIQVTIDESIVENPIDITKELTNGCLILFDDCNTISDDKQKKAIDHLMKDILEVGRKLNIWIIITNHLVIPDERKLARAMMNEMQSLTVFPKSGSAQQISYCLKHYYGLSKKQIEQIINLPSRWVTIYKSYPQCVLYDKGAYILN
jgi:adenosyl cobinamide kinase/adenosyl cobinamide phosphate guanylyltransferase